MKKIFLTFSALLLLFSLNAQQDADTGKRDFFVGGNLNFSVSSNMSYNIFLVDLPHAILLDDSDNRHTAFGFTLGKYFNDNWAIGAEVSYRNYFSEEEGEYAYQKFEAFEYSFGLFARYLFNPQDKFNIFLSPYLSYGYAENKLVFEKDKRENSNNILSIGTSIGALYQLSDKFNATINFGGLKYLRGSKKVFNKDENNFHYFGLNINMTTILIGFEYKF